MVSDGDLSRLVRPSKLTISGVPPGNWSIAMDRSAADMLSEFYIEILPPDRDDTCAPDTTMCPCCRRLRPASSMDDDGCGLCDECLVP
ncbi:hypothetical protein E0H54_16200 [Rhizobium leguminosarum bv. viciae]|nr:hypothetical protein E0H54_16200 [Rhizobium leguminosarum bv. viciae]